MEQGLSSEIVQLYKSRLSTNKIAEMLDCNCGTIYRHLKKAGVQIRSHSEANLGVKHQDRIEISKNELIDLYVNQQLSAYDIAKIKGIKPLVIYDRLTEYGIPRTHKHPRSIAKQREQMLGKPSTSRTKIKKGQHLSPETEFKPGHSSDISIAGGIASRRAQNKQPNRVEGKLLSIIEKSLPGEYRYTGDGNFLINGVCPDFVNCNGQKKVIEVFGDYWHSDKKVRTWKETELGRIMQYRSFGFDCLVLWEKDVLNKPENEIANTIKMFNKHRIRHHHVAVSSGAGGFYG